MQKSSKDDKITILSSKSATLQQKSAVSFNIPVFSFNIIVLLSPENEANCF